jgi:hypothetical protein
MIRTIFGRGASLAVKLLPEIVGPAHPPGARHIAPIVAPVTLKKSLLLIPDFISQIPLLQCKLIVASRRFEPHHLNVNNRLHQQKMWDNL